MCPSDRICMARLPHDTVWEYPTKRCNMKNTCRSHALQATCMTTHAHTHTCTNTHVHTQIHAGNRHKKPAVSSAAMKTKNTHTHTPTHTHTRAHTGHPCASRVSCTCAASTLPKKPLMLTSQPMLPGGVAKQVSEKYWDSGGTVLE